MPFFCAGMHKPVARQTCKDRTSEPKDIALLGTVTFVTNKRLALIHSQTEGDPRAKMNSLLSNNLQEFDAQTNKSQLKSASCGGRFQGVVPSRL